MAGNGKKRNRGSFKRGDPRAGRPAGRLNNATLEGRAFARGILGSKEYRDWLEARVDSKTLTPQLEVMLWHYGFGKPKETIEHTGPDGSPLELAKIVRVIMDGQQE